VSQEKYRNKEKVTKLYISPICPEVRHKWIVTKIGMWSQLSYLINCANFWQSTQEFRLHRGRNSTLPIDSRCRRYCAALPV